MNVLKKYYDGHGHGLDMENPTIKPTVKYYSVQFTNDIHVMFVSMISKYTRDKKNR